MAGSWTFVRPAAMLVPGERTGEYRVGGGRPMTRAGGGSRISIEDDAIAMPDEVESAKHRWTRIAVAY